MNNTTNESMERAIPRGSWEHVAAARILAVADCYDAMTTTRAYRGALSHEEAVSELLAGANRQFDEDVVRRFLEDDVAGKSRRVQVRLPA